MIGSVPVCRLSEVIEGKLLSVKIWNDDLMVTRGADGSIRLAGAHCPHVGTHLGMNSTFSGGVVTCPLHHFRFNVGDGACLDHKKLRLKFYRTRIRDGLVWVDKEADFVAALPDEPAPFAPPEDPLAPTHCTCSLVIEADSYRTLLPRFSTGGDLEEGVVVESPHRAFSHLRLHVVPVDERQIRVFVVAFLAASTPFAGKANRLKRFALVRRTFGLVLESWLKAPVLRALHELRAVPALRGRPEGEAVRHDVGERRYQPTRTFLNDWMFVGFVRDVERGPRVVERMGRQVKVARQADGAIHVTSADGGYRYATKVDPHYGAVMAYFNAHYAPPPWIIPDFQFNEDDVIYDSFTNTSQSTVEDIHGTVLDWTHLTGYHLYEKSSLTHKTVGDYSIGATYVTAGKRFLKYFRLGSIENINRVTIHGLCHLDFSFTGYLSKEIHFDLRLLSLFYISEGKSHEIIIASYKKDLTNAGPWFERLVYPPFKRFSYELAKRDLITETQAIYSHKRILREPQGVSRFPYLALHEYARKFYPEAAAGDRDHGHPAALHGGAESLGEVRGQPQRELASRSVGHGKTVGEPKSGVRPNCAQFDITFVGDAAAKMPQIQRL